METSHDPSAKNEEKNHQSVPMTLPSIIHQ